MHGTITSNGQYLPAMKFLYFIKGVLAVGYMAVFFMVVWQSKEMHTDIVHGKVMSQAELVLMFVARLTALILLGVISLWLANVAISLRRAMPRDR